MLRRQFKCFVSLGVLASSLWLNVAGASEPVYSTGTARQYALTHSFLPFDEDRNATLVSRYGDSFATAVYHHWIEQNLRPSDCRSLLGSCDYYLCKERERPCGARGYFLAFGYQYCSESMIKLKYQVRRDASAWLDRIALCLQQDIEAMPETFSCKKVRKGAIAGHSRCYLETGFCDLDITDQLAVIQVVGKGASTPGVFNQALQIVAGCALR